MESRSRSLSRREGIKIQSYWDEIADFYKVWYQDMYNWGAYVDIILDIFQKLLPKAPKASLRFLDCACGGTGNPAIALSDRIGGEVVASDGSLRMLQKAVESAQGLRCKPNFVPYPVGWTELNKEFGVGKFDAVLSSANSISHLPPTSDGTVKALENMYQVLKPKGLCFIDVKRYDQDLQELIYRDGRWTARIKREDGVRILNGREIKVKTVCSSQRDGDIPKNTIVLELSYDDGTKEVESFDYWPITCKQIDALMHQVDFKDVRIYDDVDPKVWKYIICVGVKQENG